MAEFNSKSIPIIVYGPMACGKTRNTQKLLVRTGCSDVQDDWSRGKSLPEGNMLVLTNMTLAEIHKAGKGRLFITCPFEAFIL